MPFFLHSCALVLLLALVLCAKTAFAMPPYAPADLPKLETFLDAHLSASDRLEAGPGLPALLTEHARLTLEAVNAAPWRDKLSPELVQAYILPLRVTEESLEAWRVPLRESLVPLLHAARTPLESANVIRTWMASRAVPGESHPWDLGPLALLKTGSGRCEELGILFICAARAVGLPARICYTPAWRDTDGNHLWVEVWDGKNWQPFSVEQPTAPAGTGWFLPHVDASALVLAKGFGPAPQAEASAGAEKDEILRSDRTGFLINRTAAYTTTGTLHVQTDTRTAGEAAPADSPLIQVHVYNSQRPRAIISTRKAEQKFTLGTGSYLISAATDAGVSYTLATVRQGQTTIVPVSAVSAVPATTPHKDTNAQSTLATRVPTALTKRNYHITSLGAVSADIPPYVQQGVGFTPPHTQHPPTTPGPQVLPLPAAAQTETAESGENGSPHLSERIDTEPASHWREIAAQAVQSCLVPGDVSATAKNINIWAAQLTVFPKATRAELGTVPLSINSMIAHKVCGSEYERVLVAIAALRSAGIPAKLTHLGQGFSGMWGPWAEFYDGKHWLPLYPATPALFGKKDGSPAAKEYYGPSAPPARMAAPTPAAPQHKDQTWNFDTHMRIPVRKEWGENWTLCRIAPSGNIVPFSQSTQKIRLVENEKGEKLLEVPQSDRYVVIW